MMKICHKFRVPMLIIYTEHIFFSILSAASSDQATCEEGKFFQIVQSRSGAHPAS